MTAGHNKFFTPINALLALAACFNLALTFYSCAKFYTYLPTSDTWIYTDFLAQAAQGHLDTSTLFQKHNDIHLIVLPKLVYFFDMWVTNGTGALAALVSLVAMLATTIIFLVVISRIHNINKQEKIFLGLINIILLMSACQIESFSNPANLQWSLLVFSATLTAWFVYCNINKKSPRAIVGIFAGIILVSLTAASPFLILVPLGLVMFGKKFARYAGLTASFLTFIAIGIGVIFFTEYIPVALAALKNVLQFTVNFWVPPVERLQSLTATFIAGMVVVMALVTIWKTGRDAKEKHTVFLALLLLFSWAVIFAASIVRGYMPTAFTFRFVNVGVLFDVSLLLLLYLQCRKHTLHQWVILSMTLLYTGLLSYVNVTEASAFSFGANHTRLTQVAHALDINDPFVVASMPGTIWEKDDFEYVQANKHLLKEAGTGIYGSKEFKNVGMPIAAFSYPASAACKTNIIKMRRLIPEQAGYRLLGETLSDQGDVFSHAYFVDEKNIIRGFAVPIEPNKNIIKNLFDNQQWAGFVNLDKSAEKNSITLYAYNKNVICQGEKIDLPDYVDLRKAVQKRQVEAAE